MSEDALGEIRDEIDVYKQQLDALKDDLEVLISINPMVVAQAAGRLTNPQNYSAEDLEKCRRFVDRWKRLATGYGL